MTLLYAAGVGTLTYVAVALVGLVLLRFANVRLDVTSESVIVAVATAVLVFKVGLARGALTRLALLGLAAHAALVFNRILSVAFIGHASDGSVDAFQFTQRALAQLVSGLVLGTAAGLIARGFPPRLPWRPAERLVRAAGFAFVIGTLVSVVWPASFIAQLLGENALATSVALLPWILAGSIAGGAYASRAGIDYRGVALLGAYVTLPFFVSLLFSTVSDVGRLSDPRFDPIAGQVRGAIAVSWFLLLLRWAGWPLGATFAQGFLTPEAGTSREQAP